MDLYHFKVLVNKQELTVVVAAENDQKAFNLAETQIEQNFLKFPKIKEIVLLERKKITSSGTAFVVS